MLTWGAYSTLACGLVAILGGFLTARAEERAEHWTPAATWSWLGPAANSAWPDTGSVPPPTP